MATKPELPLTVAVGGKRRDVVAMTTKVWTEREPSGRLVHHVGRLLVDGQPESKVLDKPKPCTKCKRPSWIGTRLGRARHDACEGWTATLPDELYAAVVFGVAADLGAQFLTPTTPTKGKTDVRRAA